MAAVMLQVIPSFYTSYSKNNLFVSGKTYEKYIVSKEYCIARHDDKMCFLFNCIYHNILIGIIRELLQKLDALFQLPTRGLSVYIFQVPLQWQNCCQKSGQLSDNLQRAFRFNHQNSGVDRMPSITKKKLERIKYKKLWLSAFQKTKSTQTSVSVFADTTEKVKKTKFELELIKFVDCFLDGLGNYSSNFMSFKMKHCELTFF